MPKHILKTMRALGLAASVTFYPVLLQAQNSSEDSNQHPRYQNRSAPSRSSTPSSQSGNNWGSKLNESRTSRSNSYQSRPAPSRTPPPPTTHGRSNVGSNSSVSNPRYGSPPSYTRSNSSVPSTTLDRSSGTRPIISRPNSNITRSNSNSSNRSGITRNPAPSANRGGNTGGFRSIHRNTTQPNRSTNINREPQGSVPNTSWHNRGGQVRNRPNPSLRNRSNSDLGQTVSPHPSRDFNPYRNDSSSSRRSVTNNRNESDRSRINLWGNKTLGTSVTGGTRENRDGTNPVGGGRPDYRGNPPDNRRDQDAKDRRKLPGGENPNHDKKREGDDQSHRGDRPGKKEDSYSRGGERDRLGDRYHYRGLSRLHWRGLGYGRGYYTYPSIWWDVRYSSRLYPGLTYSHRRSRSSLGYYCGPFILINGFRYYSSNYSDNAYYDVYYDDTYYDSSRQTNRVILYANAQYRGHNLELYAGQSIADLSHYQTGADRSFDELISSVRVYGDVTLVLYEDTDFRGNRVYLQKSVSDFSGEAFTLAFDDEVSSVEVLPGSYQWHGYEAFESEVGLRPEGSNPSPVTAADPSIYLPPGADSQIGIILYDQPNFSGRRLELSVGNVIPDLAVRLRDAGSSWDDAVASLQVLGEAEVFIYTESNFYGAGMVLDRDVANFSLAPSLTEFVGSISSIVVKPYKSQTL